MTINQLIKNLQEFVDIEDVGNVEFEILDSNADPVEDPVLIPVSDEIDFGDAGVNLHD